MEKDMRKIILIIVLIAFCISPLISQDKANIEKKINLAGTWKGVINLDDGADEVTMVIAYKEGKMTGTLTDKFGHFDDTAMQEIKLDGNKFSFFAFAATTEGDVRVDKTASIKGNTMEGSWEVPCRFGTWNARKVIKK